jgi:hypothetical protein
MPLVREQRLFRMSKGLALRRVVAEINSSRWQYLKATNLLNNNFPSLKPSTDSSNRCNMSNYQIVEFTSCSMEFNVKKSFENHLC